MGAPPWSPQPTAGDTDPRGTRGIHRQRLASLVAVSVRGRREALADVRPGALDAFVDLAGLGPGRYNLRVQFDPSQQFGVREIRPPAVNVTIKAIK